MATITQDREQTEAHVFALTGAVDTPMAWRILPPKRLKGKIQPRNLWGSIAECWDKLAAANSEGAGVFFMIQATDGRGFGGANVTGFRAAFVEDDSGKITWQQIRDAGLAPSFVVQSKNGQHVYFKVAEGEDVTDCRPLLRALAAKLGTDPNVADTARVLRVAGFSWTKEPEPFPVTIVEDATTLVSYSVKHIVEALGIDPAASAEKAGPAHSHPPKKSAGPSAGPDGFFKAAKTASHNDNASPFSGIDDRTYAPTEERIRRAKAYLANVPPAVEGQGGDPATLKVAAVIAVDFDLGDEDALEAMLDWNARCSPPWEESELLVKIRNARRYAKGFPGSKCAAEERRPPSSAGAAATDGAGTAAPEDETVCYRPYPSDWGRPEPLPGGKRAPGTGPLVNYHPVKKAKAAADVDETDEAAVDEQKKAESQDESEQARVDKHDKWTQTQPSNDQLAEQIPTIERYCHTIVVASEVGNDFFRLAPDNLVKSVKIEALRSDVYDVARAAMGGKAPALTTCQTIAGLLQHRPKKYVQIALTRWVGETKLARHEVAAPKEGDWSAWREFTDRCSCPDTVKAWTWTCFLSSEEYRGREALVLQGGGLDGKSEYGRAVHDILGPAAVAAKVPDDEKRFEIASLVNRRLAFFDDVRDRDFMHGQTMRAILSGAHLPYERKGVDVQTAFFYLRCLVTMNPFPSIFSNDRAERTRVRVVTVAAISADKSLGDSTWATRLREQASAYLFECRRAFEKLISGQPSGAGLPETEACARALEGAAAESIDEDFDFLVTRLEFSSGAFIKSSELSVLLSIGHIRPAAAYKWLRSKGASQLVKKTDGKIIRGWQGVSKSSGPFGEVFAARKAS